MKEFKKKLLLIDGHALFYRAYHALPAMASKDGFPTGAIFGFFSMFFKALADIKPTHALVTFDMQGKTFRDDMAGDYKAHRKAPDNEMMVQFPKIREILDALEIPIYEKQGFEADDLLGIIAHKTPKDVLNIIVTGDMDLLQLIDNRTHIYRFKTGFSDIQIFDIDKMVEIYGLHPGQWVDLKAIKGDASDNIPGVPGIGEKGALELIKLFGSLDGVYEAVDKDSKKIKDGTKKKLIEGKAKAYLSYKLSHINQKNELEFNFEKTEMSDYDAEKVASIFHSVGIHAMDARLPGGKKVEAKPVVAVEGKPNALIKNAEQALLAAYLANPGQRHYELGDWAELVEELNGGKSAKGGPASGGKLLKIYEDIEVPLMGVLARMHDRGIKLDQEWLADLSKKLGKRINQLIKEIHKLAGMDFNISSPKQLSEVLFDKLQIPTENIKKNKKSGGISTAAGELEKMRGLHPIIDLIFEYRELTKLKSTYIDALPELVEKDGRVHTTYSQTIAATGRLSSLNPNLQNIPIRTDLGNEVRKAFIADKGNVLLSLDYSQIELRIAASLSGDEEMIKIFSASAENKSYGGSADSAFVATSAKEAALAKAGKSGGDFHTATAARIFGTSEDKVTPNQRRDAKTINFSVLYGVSAFGLSSRSEMTQAEARDHIKNYFTVFHKLKKYIDDTIALTKKQGYITNPLGRVRYLPEINASNFAVRGAAERQAFNMPLQSLAADIIKLAMLEIDKKYPDVAMLLSVHDELVFEVKKNDAAKYSKIFKDIMESVYKLEVPVEVNAKVGENWAEMEEVEV